MINFMPAVTLRTKEVEKFHCVCESKLDVEDLSARLREHHVRVARRLPELWQQRVAIDRRIHDGRFRDRHRGTSHVFKSIFVVFESFLSYRTRRSRNVISSGVRLIHERILRYPSTCGYSKKRLGQL